jgi:hypothetical protein
VLEFKFSSFILNKNALVYFKIECVGKNTPQLIIIIPIFSRATSLALFIASPDSCPGP